METKTLPSSHAAESSKSGARILEHRTKSPPGISIHRILVPTDFSSASSNALRYAVRLGQVLGGELTFIHVLPRPVPAALNEFPIDYPAEPRSECEERLDVLAEAARTNGIRATRWLVRTGSPTHEIVEAAKDLDVDLIMIATHGYTSWKHFAIGSTADRVARAAPCPVLVVREKEHEFV
jgi:nucleotide-binding universal stress UspA family protein